MVVYGHNILLSALHLLFSFLFSNYDAYYYSESKPIVYKNVV